MNTLTAATDAERVALADLLSHAFAFPAADAPVWFERAGHDHVLAWREGGALVGGLITIPMGQYFGGVSVPMEGVAGVGVAPEHRANGAATRMMQALVRDMRARGVALSTLYPATVPLYQRAGYERAGGRWRTAVRPQELPTRHDPLLRVVTLPSVGEGETRALYEAHCRLRNGPLDRGPYLWSRIQSPVRMTVRRMGVEGPDGLEGYVVVSHVAKDGHDTEVHVVDAVAATARAADAILATLGAYRSLALEVRWHGGPHDTLTQRLRDRRHAVTLADFWMLRLVDVPRALALRESWGRSCGEGPRPDRRAPSREMARGAGAVRRKRDAEGLFMPWRGQFPYGRQKCSARAGVAPAKSAVAAARSRSSPAASPSAARASAVRKPVYNVASARTSSATPPPSDFVTSTLPPSTATRHAPSFSGTTSSRTTKVTAAFTKGL